MIPAAIQLRDNYRGLREWVSEFQDALDSENVSDIFRQRKVFQSVARSLESRFSTGMSGDTTLQLGFSWLKVATKIGSPISWAQNLFGIRAQLNRMILGPTGRNSIKSLLKLFGEENSQRGQLVEKELLRSSHTS